MEGGKEEVSAGWGPKEEDDIFLLFSASLVCFKCLCYMVIGGPFLNDIIMMSQFPFTYFSSYFCFLIFISHF